MTGHSSRSPRWGGRAGPALVVLALGLAGARGLAAQQLPIRTAPPPGQALICSPVATAAEVAPADRDAAAAERLVRAATQAMLLGDLDGALAFLDRALALDPASSEAVYLQARIHEQQGRPDATADALCRYLRLDPGGPSADEVRRRLDEARDRGAGRPLLQTYRRALALEQAGELADSEAAFTELISARPAATVALYNRAVVRLAMGRDEEARSDLRRYLELEPGAPDTHEIRQYLGVAHGAARVARPGTAFLAGALLPGGGQFYTRRPLVGTAVLAAAGGALATGLLYERTTVQCLDVVARVCPDDDIVGQEVDRPLLGPAIGVAAGVALVAALEAMVHAGRQDRAPRRPTAEEASPVRLAPSGMLSYDGVSLRLDLVRLNF
jgi:tetratricopeptide (TPR) repeat protein